MSPLSERLAVGDVLSNRYRFMRAAGGSGAYWKAVHVLPAEHGLVTLAVHYVSSDIPGLSVESVFRAYLARITTLQSLPIHDGLAMWTDICWDKS